MQYQKDILRGLQQRSLRLQDEHSSTSNDRESIKHELFVQTVSAHPRIGGTHADMSSGASEVYACANSTLDFMHLGYVVDEMNMDQPQVIELQVDNTTAEAFMNNSVKKSKLKHIDCRQEWVKTIRDKDIVTPVHVHTDLNTADFFTKILSPAKFLDIRDRFMVQYSVLK